MIFSDRNCNYPQPKYAMWWLTQFRRWGMVDGAPDYEGVAEQVMRPDIYEEAMKEIGFAHGGATTKPETLFDGVDVRSDEARGVRDGLRRPQPEGLSHDNRVGRPRRSMTPTPRRRHHRRLGAAEWRARRCCRSSASALLVVWTLVSRHGGTDLPSPARTWEESSRYVARAVRQARRDGPGHPALHVVLAGAGGEGLRARAADRHAARLPARALDALPQGVRSRSSRSCGRSRRWRGCRSAWCSSRSSEPAALFTIAICAMWPTVLNTAVGVRAIPQDYLNVGARAEALADARRCSKIIIPATLPYIFTGFRLSLGIAWLVIVAVGDADRRARRRRLPLAGVQQPHLRAHHPVHRHDRPRRLRARPADERRRTRLRGA